MAMGDIEKMIAVGLIWGSTNALIRKGAIIYDTNKTRNASHSKQEQSLIASHLRNILSLVLTWQYSVPLLINLSASATFFALIGHTPISLAVPVTNATTFAATAVMGLFLGEDVRFWHALFGTFFIVFGVWLCVM